MPILNPSITTWSTAYIAYPMWIEHEQISGAARILLDSLKIDRVVDRGSFRSRWPLPERLEDGRAYWEIEFTTPCWCRSTPIDTGRGGYFDQAEGVPRYL